MFLKYSINVNMHWEHIYQVTPMPFFYFRAQLEVMSSPPSVIFFALHDNFQKKLPTTTETETPCASLENRSDHVSDSSQSDGRLSRPVGLDRGKAAIKGSPAWGD